MRSAGSRLARLEGALALAAAVVALVAVAMPATAFTVSTLDVELEYSEPNVVMNSDISLTVKVKDASTGEPVDGCHVVLHIEPQAGGGDGNGNGGDGHTHGTPLEVPAGVPVPDVDIDVTADPRSGWNLRVRTENFTFAPWNASREVVWGEGHAHLYIDEVKIGRLYGEWYHIAKLDVGTHDVRVTLNANNHSDLAKDGQVIADTATVVSSGPGSHSHMMARYEVPDGVAVPTVDLSVHEDPKAGWNLHLETTAFRWAPQNASTPPVMGEGHAHLYVDGEKVARLYCDWYPLMGLSAGDHEVRVTLNANNHSDYSREGVVVEDVETIVVPETDAPPVHTQGSVSLTARPGSGSGEYVVDHKFPRAGEYSIEVHVSGAGHDEVAVTFEVEVYEGDPAALTILGVMVYVVLAVAVVLTVQFLYSRNRARRLQRMMGGGEGGA
jgi:hypothetical protein